MPFDTDYPNRKDRRKPYRKSAAFDRSCRPHGGCPYCERGRRHFDHKYRYYADMEIEMWVKGEFEMECDCCGRKQTELVVDNLFRDIRDGEEYIVCSTCLMLTDEDFFELMAMDRSIPVAERFATLSKAEYKVYYTCDDPDETDPRSILNSYSEALEEATRLAIIDGRHTMVIRDGVIVAIGQPDK